MIKKSKIFFLSGLLLIGCVAENSQTTQHSQLDNLIASNHAQIEVVTMPTVPGICPNNYVDVFGDGRMLMPMSATACMGFLNSYYYEYPNVYNNAIMQQIVRNADQRCNYQRAIDISARDPNSESGQYRIGVLRYSNSFEAIMNAMRSNNPSASVPFRTALNNYRNVCLEMINEARAAYFQ